MTEYDNTNRFTLFKNEKKREGKKDADYNGSINIDGKEYWLNCWITQGKKGKFFSGSVKPKDGGGSSRSAPAAPKTDPRITSGARVHEPLDDEIPFAPEFR